MLGNYNDKTYEGAKIVYSATRLFTILILLFTSNIYGNVTSKNANNPQQNISHIEDKIKKKQAILLKIQKSNTTQYMSVYDDLAELTIAKNKLLLELDRVDDIDTDRTCDLALNYTEIEFIKTKYYKTPFHDEIAKTLQNIASLYEQCHPPMTEKYLQSILKIKEHIYLEDSAEVASAHDALGDYYRIYMANFRRAIKEYDEAKRIREKIYGINNPRITENYERLALSLYYHGDKMNRAEKLLLDSITIRKNSLSNKKFPLYNAYMDLGIYYSMKDEYDKSIIYLHKALKLFQGKIDINYIVIISELSQVYFNQDDLHNALKFGEEAYNVSKKFYGNDTHHQVLENYNRLTEIREIMNKNKGKEK